MRILPSFFYAILFSVGSAAEAQETPQTAKPLFKQDTLSICIMGDMMMHTKQIETARQKDGTYDFSSYFSLITDRIQAADIAIANMEFCLAGEPYSGYPTFSAPDNYGEYMAQCGFDIFLAANNHIFDKGAAGAERSTESRFAACQNLPIQGKRLILSRL